jgi:hypothetical protein
VHYRLVGLEHRLSHCVTAIGYCDDKVDSLTQLRQKVDTNVDHCSLSVYQTVEKRNFVHTGLNLAYLRGIRKRRLYLMKGAIQKVHVKN